MKAGSAVKKAKVRPAKIVHRRTVKHANHSELLRDVCVGRHLIYRALLLCVSLLRYQLLCVISFMVLVSIEYRVIYRTPAPLQRCGY